jgi:hypothetical protein
MRLRHLYIDALVVALLISSGFHLLAGRWTDRLLSRHKVVRAVGFGILFLAIPCFFWRGWFFLTIGTLLAGSGAWRLFAPEHSIRMQKKSYPRWVHGLLLLGGAGLIYTLQP